MRYVSIIVSLHPYTLAFSLFTSCISALRKTRFTLCRSTFDTSWCHRFPFALIIRPKGLRTLAHFGWKKFLFKIPLRRPQGLSICCGPRKCDDERTPLFHGGAIRHLASLTQGPEYNTGIHKLVLKVLSPGFIVGSTYVTVHLNATSVTLIFRSCYFGNFSDIKSNEGYLFFT